MRFEENELYQEIKLYDDDGTKVGEAEVDVKGKMLSRLTIYHPYRGCGYGTTAVMELTKKYDIEDLWVNASNDVAIRVYEKCGFVKLEPTMYRMARKVRHE